MKIRLGFIFQFIWIYLSTWKGDLQTPLLKQILYNINKQYNNNTNNNIKNCIYVHVNLEIMIWNYQFENYILKLWHPTYTPTLCDQQKKQVWSLEIHLRQVPALDQYVQPIFLDLNKHIVLTISVTNCTVHCNFSLKLV